MTYWFKRLFVFNEQSYRRSLPVCMGGPGVSIFR
jgi:hypothetical protein